MRTDPDPLLRARLAELYGEASKHSGYQTMPDFVARALDFQVEIDQRWRGDQVRLDYVRRMLGMSLGRWCDFGANSGFFALTLAHDEPRREVVALEANPHHTELIARVAAACEVRNLEVLNLTLGMQELQAIGQNDVLLHLNVLHHAGKDFDQGSVSAPEEFEEYAAAYLRRLTETTGTIVFQAGTNLWGDKRLPLLRRDQHVERVLFWSQLLRSSGWHITDCALAEFAESASPRYVSLPETLRAGLDADPSKAARREIGTWLDELRIDHHPGEFFLRPLFVCSRDAHSVAPRGGQGRA